MSCACCQHQAPGLPPAGYLEPPSSHVLSLLLPAGDESLDYVHFLVPYEHEDRLPALFSHLKVCLCLIVFEQQFWHMAAAWRQSTAYLLPADTAAPGCAGVPTASTGSARPSLRIPPFLATLAVQPCPGGCGRAAAHDAVGGGLSDGGPQGGAGACAGKRLGRRAQRGRLHRTQPPRSAQDKLSERDPHALSHPLVPLC